MRTLKFTVDRQIHNQQHQHNTQAYIQQVLCQQLGDFGFSLSHLTHQHGQLAIQVEHNQIELNIQCQDVEQHVSCMISAHANEEQDWFGKIETQSVIKQLAQTVETTLKKEQGFAQFEWKA